MHPEVAASLNNLAELYRITGDYAKAEPLYQRALQILEQALGPTHPQVATSLNNLTVLYAAQRDFTKAVMHQARANTVDERNIALNLTRGSERQQLLYLATLSGRAEMTFALHVESAPDDPGARRLALTTVLQRKGRALDAIMESMTTTRRTLDPQDQALLDQLTTTRARLATLVLGRLNTSDTGHYRATIRSLEAQTEHLEADLSRRSAAFRTQTQPVTMEAIQAVIPPEAALVEFVRFHAYDFQHSQWLSPRYAAYVLHHQGESQWVNLGEAHRLEAAVQGLREALRDPSRQNLKQLARTLDAQLMQPVRQLLGEKCLVLLSPGGVLHLVPFAALIDEQERYLVEQYRFIYLTNGRDLLRLQVKTQPSQGPLVVANPAFGMTRGAGGHEGTSSPQRPTTLTTAERNAVNFSQLFFDPLPGTAGEAQALQTLLAGATVFTQASATKGAITQRTAPGTGARGRRDAVNEPVACE